MWGFTHLAYHSNPRSPTNQRQVDFHVECRCISLIILILIPFEAGCKYKLDIDNHVSTTIDVHSMMIIVLMLLCNVLFSHELQFHFFFCCCFFFVFFSLSTFLCLPFTLCLRPILEFDALLLCCLEFFSIPWFTYSFEFPFGLVFPSWFFPLLLDLLVSVQGRLFLLSLSLSHFLHYSRKMPIGFITILFFTFSCTCTNCMNQKQ